MPEPRALTDQTILARRDCVVVRPQKQSYVLYNSHTDELHLVPRDGHLVFMLCDGWRTVADVVQEVTRACGEPVERVRPSVLAFLGNLERRGLLAQADV